MTPAILLRRLVDPVGGAPVLYSWTIFDQPTGFVREQGKTWFTTPRGAVNEALSRPGVSPQQ